MKKQRLSQSANSEGKIKKKNWFLKHKIITGILIFIVLMIIIGVNSEGSKQSFKQGMDAGKEQVSNQKPTLEITPTTIPTKPAEEKNKVESFTESDALKKIKGYELKENIESLGKPTIGMYLSVYLEEVVLKGMKIDATTKGGSWSAEDKNNDGIYTINYKFRSSGLDSIYTWEVGKDSIKAINGKAITITPELGPQEKEVSGTDNEKEVYEYSTNLYKKYESTFGSYEAETKATSETAKKFGITEEEVEEIVSRLMDTKL